MSRRKMADLKKLIYRGAFEALYFSGASALLRPFVGGVGSILTLHHVRPPRSDKFQPNRFLEIAPGFLEAIVRRLKRDKIDLVSLDEVVRRLRERDFRRPFVAITIDDGYRDTKAFAYPVLKKHGAPFAVFVPASFPEHRGQLWWAVLEQAVAANDAVVVDFSGEERRFTCATLAQKHAVYLALRGELAARESEAEMLVIVRRLATRYNIDMAAICARLCMTWDEIVALATDPLVTIGAHTVNHIMLGRADEQTMRAELADGRAILEAKLGRKVDHIAYPYGDAVSAGAREYAAAAALGYKTALTTRPGMLFPEHAGHLTALPRLTVSGELQLMRYVEVLVSGAATALWNRFRRLQAA
jgi:peptidoglycan/xylan/chitin deacetylase (PgdA/CDA1 family)